ncbi:DNA mismatch repair endonuclease MutL [candidate division KSB1 bacterium]|nr:DNA mismatch repair endonuclease MutL [candidate division KSB1 bacterium]
MSNSNKVKILSEDLTNKIAAGEVVDRPASVVKELVENSIDAGSDQITVVVKGGGKSLIKVVDNGTGMNREDAILSVQRHTTSKIATYNDLHNIHTLGFRGEALASIASISRMELRSTVHNENEGVLIKLEGGVVEDVSAIADVRGTSISVKNLFYNTPARRKFLKQDDTEYRYILNIMNRFTLAYRDIEFTLYNNDQQVFDLKPAPLEKRIVDVLGSRYQDKIVEVNDNHNFVQISGYVGNQESAKKSRADQYLFLNGRYIQSRALNHAIISAYGTILPRGEFPMFVIFLEIDPRRVDVNVHPSKMEVKFSDERSVYSILRGSVKEALSTGQVIPAFQFSKPEVPIAEKPRLSQSFQTQIPLSVFERGNLVEAIKSDEPVEIEEAEVEKTQPVKTPGAQKHLERANVWQVHNKYIISEIKSGFIIIDQHAAHERILYEKALHNFERSNPSSQQLLFPIVVDLNADDYSYLMEILPFLEKLGFIIKGFSGNTVVVEGIPSDVKLGNKENIIHEILEDYHKNKSTGLDIRDNVAKSFACKSAVKFGKKLSLGEMNSLIDQLFATQSPYFCPHGRPVIITLSLDELNKRFGRT